MGSVFGTRLGRRSFLIALMAFSLLFVFAFPGVALTGSAFESEDGNLKVNGGSGSLDWANVSQTNGNDLDSGTGDDSLKGAEQDAVPGIVDGSIPPSKSDLKTFGVFIENDTPGWMHMFWTRVQEPQGTTNMDFEFNQKRCVQGVDTSGCSTNGTTPTRTLDDILITYNLSSGGDNVSLWLHRWITGGAGLCEDSQEGGTGASGGPCWDVGENLTDSGDATGSINAAAIPGNETDGLATQSGFSANTFGEASVDLSAIFGESCFALGGVYLKSRSSDTFTSALKDFIAPTAINVSNCGSIKVVKKDDAGNNLAGVKFKLYRDDEDPTPSQGPPAVGFEPGSGDVQINANGTTGTFECETTSNGTGNCEWSNLTFGKYWLHETFTPTGYTAPAANPQLINVNSTTQVVVNVTNNRQPASLKLKKTDDLGNPLAGATFTLYTDVAPLGPSNPRTAADTATSFSCTTLASPPADPADAGTCTITNILPAGPYWVVETTTPAGYTTAPDQHVVLALGENKDITATPFVNPRQHKVIVIVCHEASNTLAASDVTIDSTEKTSLGTGATLPEGVSEAELCGLGGASYGGIDNHPTKSASIKVGSDAHS